MVGRDVSFKVEKKEVNLGEPVLQVKNLVVRNQQGLAALKELNIEVKAGEILGIAGVDGNGQSELIEALTGLRSIDSGQVLLVGNDITNHTPREISEAGLSHIPEDRHKHGLVLDFSMSENMVLETYFHPAYNKAGFLNYDAIDRHAEALIKQFDVRTPSIYNKARSLSGGNQQKQLLPGKYTRIRTC